MKTRNSNRFADQECEEYDRDREQLRANKQYRAEKRNHKPSKRDRAAKRPDKYGAWDK